jgi:hypothetical protein
MKLSQSEQRGRARRNLKSMGGDARALKAPQLRWINHRRCARA